MLPVIWVTASSDLAVGWAEADLPSLGMIEGVLWEVVLFIVERCWICGFGQWSCGSLLLVVSYFILSFILRTGPVSCCFYFYFIFPAFFASALWVLLLPFGGVGSFVQA